MALKFGLASSKMSTAPFSVVEEHLFDKIQKSHDDGIDLVDSLRNNKYINLDAIAPTLKTAPKSDPVLQEQYNRMYSAELSQHMTRVKNLQENKYKAYATMESDWLTPPLKAKVQAHPDYESIIRNDPLALLKLIRIYQHESNGVTYPAANALQHLANFINAK
jgi:hypothetical protein